MKTVTIRELHARTGALVRDAWRHGEIRVTDRGQVVAKIVPETQPPQVPYFARRKYVSAGIKKLIESGRLGRGGTDSTVAISEDREDRA
jgi:antitoxin (DNA-binding transcriptional repressor) of toxin-antitoxin stability system